MIRLLLFLLLASSASAASIGVTPATLEFVLREGETAQQVITVYSSEEVQLSSNAPYLQLQREGEQYVVRADATDLRAGNHSAHISISAKDSEKLGISLGNVVKANVIVLDTINFKTGFAIAAGTVIIGLVAYFALEKLAVVALIRRALLAIKP